MLYEELLKDKIEGMSYAEIGKKYGVSRQRIQQILSPPKALRDYIFIQEQGLCAYCHEDVTQRGHLHHQKLVNDYNSPDNLKLLCPSCHAIAHSKTLSIYQKCFVCGAVFTSRDINARIKRNISGKFFCSKHCQGKWLGKTFGKLPKPKREKIAYNKKQGKWYWGTPSKAMSL